MENSASRTIDHISAISLINEMFLPNAQLKYP
jgi:hypothetical protein